MATMTELTVDHTKLADARLEERPMPAPGDGEALLKVESFGLTANNVTYGLVGHQIGYWKFFPVPEEGRGIIPVWGFGEVIESQSDDLKVGERLYGYFPMATHMVMKPLRKKGAVIDIAEHRSALPPAYNRYQLTGEEPEALKSREDARSVLFPLFATSYIIFDWLTDNDFFGAKQVVITSASSKTSFGLGAVLQREASEKPTVGMTSARNKAFTEGLGVYGSVTTYDDVASLDSSVPTALIDMSGNASVITAVHEHMGDNLVVSSIVGATHWDQPRQQSPLPGAKPTMFFAPGQIMKREGELGAGVLMQRALTAWMAVSDSLDGSFSYQHLCGPEATKDAWLKSVAGEVSPSTGLVVSLWEA